MPYDPGLAERIREVLRDTPGLTERKIWVGRGRDFAASLPPK